MSEKKWYIVNTYSGCENRAKFSLEERIKASKHQDAFGRILIPTETVINPKDGTRKASGKKFFPGYILIEMNLTDETWHLVKGTPKISGFVGGGSNPPAMREKDVQNILREMSTTVEKSETAINIDVDDKVRILTGSFVNFVGTVSSIDREKAKLSVMVSILGRVVPVDLEFKQVEKVDA